MLTLSQYGGGGNMSAEISRSAYYALGRASNGTKMLNSAASVEAGFLAGYWAQNTGNLPVKEIRKYSSVTSVTRFTTIGSANFLPVCGRWGKNSAVFPVLFSAPWQVFGPPLNAP